MADETSTIDVEALAAINRDLAKKVVELLGTEEQFELYAEDIVMEFPYGPSLGMPDRFESKPKVVDYVRHILEGLRGIVIRQMSFSSVAGDPSTVFAEYEADCPTPGGNGWCLECGASSWCRESCGRSQLGRHETKWTPAG